MEGFLLEGGVNSVSIPRIPQCLTAHTHHLIPHYPLAETSPLLGIYLPMVG